MSFRESEAILEEAVARAEEESRERGRLEDFVAGMRSGGATAASADAAALQSANDRAASLERRAIRAEDRLREADRRLAEATALERARAARGRGGGEGGDGAPGGDEPGECAEKLKLELKERKRQMHKLQEVYGRLKERFAAAGGAAEAFEGAKEVEDLRYELRLAETKRVAERKRAELLSLELGKAQRALERERHAHAARGGPARAPLEARTEANARERATEGDDAKVGNPTKAQQTNRRRAPERAGENAARA